MPTVLEPGVVLGGRHRLDQPLGEGGMGVVWAATNTLTGMPVALKLLKEKSGGDPGSKPSSDARSRQRFLREARAACAVRHPNVVQVYDIVELDDGIPMIVMELLTGESLRTRLRRSAPLGVREAAIFLVPVVSAVGAAHALGIVHRDLKPDNIFLSDDERHGKRVKVLDFGLAKENALDPETQDAGLTTTGAMIGTPYYMSPEQVFGDSDIDHRTDVWALGVLIYECLTGARPTQAEGVGQVMKMVTTGTIEPLSRAAPSVPAELAAVVDRMLSRDRTKRPALAEVFEVLRAQASRDVDADPCPTPPPALTRRTSSPDPGRTMTTLDPSLVDTPFIASDARPSPSRRWVAGAVLAALGLVGWWATRQSYPPEAVADTASAAAPSAMAEAPTTAEAPLPPPMTTSAEAHPPVAAVPASSPSPEGSAPVSKRRPAARGATPRIVETAAPVASVGAPAPAAAAPPAPAGTLQGAVVAKPPF